jgi:hypothetical protein
MFMNSIMGTIVGRLMGLQRYAAWAEAGRFTRAHTPVLLDAYQAFARTSQSGVPRQPFKGHDLWKILQRFQPRKIVELGSGTTSAVFAHYAQRHGADYVCFEHNAQWAAITEKCLREAGLIGSDSPIKVVEMAADDSASGFVAPLPDDADLIYVDGPPCPIIGGVKKPNNDVPRLFERGGRPRCIVVDGRLETVDSIRRHPSAKGYSFEASYVYALRRRLWGEALRFREHSIIFRPQ